MNPGSGTGTVFAEHETEVGTVDLAIRIQICRGATFTPGTQQKPDVRTVDLAVEVQVGVAVQEGRNITVEFEVDLIDLRLGVPGQGIV